MTSFILFKKKYFCYFALIVYENWNMRSIHLSWFICTYLCSFCLPFCSDFIICFVYDILPPCHSIVIVIFSTSDCNIFSNNLSETIDKQGTHLNSFLLLIITIVNHRRLSCWTSLYALLAIKATNLSFEFTTIEKVIMCNTRKFS